MAQLVLMSDCGLLPALFGPRALELIRHLQSAGPNPYSADKTLVTAEEGGAALGALVGALARTTRSEEPRTALALLAWYGPSAFLRLPVLARAGLALAGLDLDDFYLSHLAVSPQWRGEGAGRALLEAGEARAALLGSRTLVLDVETGNEGALAFYGRLGYRRASNFRIGLGRRGSFGFHRMAKSL